MLLNCVHLSRSYRRFCRDSASSYFASTCICGEAKVLAEERQYMVLKAIGDCTDMRAGVDLKAVCDSVVVEDVVQLGRVKAQAILIAHIHRDSPILLEIPDVLIDERERRIGREFRHDLRLRNAVLRRQVEVERRVLWIGRPCRCGCILRGAEAGRLCREIGRRLWPPQPSSRWRWPAPSSDRPGPVRRRPSETCSRGS